MSIGALGGDAAQHGDEDFFVWGREVTLSHGLDDLTELFLSIPHRSIRVHAAEAEEHHRSQTETGLGDLTLGAVRWVESSERGRTELRAGLSIPAGDEGRLPPEAFVDHDAASAAGIAVRPHSHLRLGRAHGTRSWECLSSATGAKSGRGSWT